MRCFKLLGERMIARDFDRQVNYDVTASGYTEVSTNAISWTSSAVSSSTALGSVSCYLKAATDNQTIPFTSITNTQNTFYGGPTYTYQKMNRIGIRSKSMIPTNGLDAVVLIWHTPGTSTITYLRHYIKTTGATATEPYYTLEEVYIITGNSSSSSSASSSTSSASSSTSSTSSSSSSASSTASSSSSSSASSAG